MKWISLRSRRLCGDFLFSALSASLLVYGVGAAHAQSPDDPPARTETKSTATGIEEVVVYARKRAELIEDTPVSMTALSGEQLQNTGVTRLDEVQRLAPNLSIFRTLSNETVSINMRGVGNFPFVYYDQGVGLYVDGVYLSRNSGSILDIVDFEGMEILRGPQGTLFGKNNLGGAINISTVKPKDELEIIAMIRAGSYDQLDTRLTMNIPLAWGVLEDKLFSRFTFASFNNDGYTFNVARDEYASDRNNLNFLGTLRFVPTEDITFDVTGTWSRSHITPPGYQCIWVDPRPGQGIPNQVTQPFIDQVVVDNGGQPGDARTNCNASSPYRFYGDTDSLSDVESYGTWGVLNWDLGSTDWFTDLHLKYIGSWREQTQRVQLDTDGTMFPIGSSSNIGGGVYQGNKGDQEQIQQEIQINAAAWNNRIKLVGGLFSFWDRSNRNTHLRFFPGTLADQIGQGLTQNFITTDNWDWAVYAQGTIDLTDILSLTTGLRYTQEKKGIDRLVLGMQFDNPDFEPIVAADFTNAQKWDAVTPMASIALRAPDEWLDPATLGHLMAYFTYSRGFRGGGFNGGARTALPEDVEPFDPEFIDSFELGLKTYGLDRRLNLSLALFLEQREDQQVPQLVGGDCPPENPECIPPVRVLTRNATESESRGFELEIQAVPLPQLLVDGSVGYLHTEFGGFDGAQNAITGDPIDRAGQSFAFIPDWTTHLGAQYTQPLDFFDNDRLNGSLTPRIDWSWRDNVFNWSPEITELRQQAYSLVNFRLTYLFANGKARIAFFIDNLTDEEYFIDSLAVGPRLTGAVQRYYEPPRWFGGEVSYTFN